MKEEELMKEHNNHNKICISEHKHEEQQTITREVITEFINSRLRLWAFVLVGEAFLFLLKDLKIYHNNAKKVTN
jgi:hypothetical protein